MREEPRGHHPCPRSAPGEPARRENTGRSDEDMSHYARRGRRVAAEGEMNEERAHRLGTGRRGHTALPQARHLLAAWGITSRHSGQLLVAAGGEAGAGLSRALVTRKIT